MPYDLTKDGVKVQFRQITSRIVSSSMSSWLGSLSGKASRVVTLRPSRQISDGSPGTQPVFVPVEALPTANATQRNATRRNETQRDANIPRLATPYLMNVNQQPLRHKSGKE